MSCVFCKIISREIPAKVIAETDDILVIADRAPSAPIHYLIMPKKHVADLSSLTQVDSISAGNILVMAQQLSQETTTAKNFKLVINNGAGAGQSVFHLHAHFLAGFTGPADHVL